jgi:hypothetical protein
LTALEKSRVERLFNTLQDRLPAELALKGIQDDPGGESAPQQTAS